MMKLFRDCSVLLLIKSRIDLHMIYTWITHGNMCDVFDDDGHSCRCSSFSMISPWLWLLRNRPAFSTDPFRAAPARRGFTAFSAGAFIAVTSHYPTVVRIIINSEAFPNCWVRSNIELVGPSRNQLAFSTGEFQAVAADCEFDIYRRNGVFSWPVQSGSTLLRHASDTGGIWSSFRAVLIELNHPRTDLRLPLARFKLHVVMAFSAGSFRATRWLVCHSGNKTATAMK